MSMIMTNDIISVGADDDHFIDCLNPQLPQKAANGPDGGSAATMGPGDH